MSVTLAEIEREVAARTGPYFRYTASGGDVSHVTVPDEQSTIDVGSSILWVLRRGLMEDGSAVVGYNANDRQRRLKSIDRATGELAVDRSYSTDPVDGEVVELVYLNPAHELRPAVLRGLKRCYFEHRVAVTLTGAAAERTLTDDLPWLTQRWQVLGLASAPPNGLELPMGLWWDNLVESAGTLIAQGWPDPFPYNLQVRAYRPADTWVNDDDSTTGPTADADTLAVDLEYAARAGHIEAWRTSRARLVQPAAAGLAVSQKEAADAFTDIAHARVKLAPFRIQYGEPYTPDLVAVVV